MSCWKCGTDCEAGEVECKGCAQVTVTSSNVQQVAINWGKVMSFDDMREVMQALGLWVVRGSELHEKLRRFTDE